MSAWKVLLLGGASGTGKTAAAREVARRTGVSTLLADDVRLAMQRVTTADQQPTLHHILAGDVVWDGPEQELVDGFIGVAAVVSHALEMVVAHHVVVEGVGAVVIEGDGILPELAVRRRFVESDVRPGQVRGVFLFDNSPRLKPGDSCFNEASQRRANPSRSYGLSTG